MTDVIGSNGKPFSKLPVITIDSAVASSKSNNSCNECGSYDFSTSDDEHSHQPSPLQPITNHLNEITPTASPARKPKSEAFTMTGDKIIKYEAKISPAFAKLKQSELPKHTQIALDMSLAKITTNSPQNGPSSTFSKYNKRQRPRVDRNLSLDSDFHYLQGSLNAEMKLLSGSDTTVQQVLATSNSTLQQNDVLSNRENFPQPDTPQAYCSMPSSPMVLRQERFFEYSTQTATFQAEATVFEHAQNDILSKPNDQNCNTASLYPTVPGKIDIGAAELLAKRLFDLDGFRKSDVAAHLKKTNEFGKTVLSEYMNLFEFDGSKIDEALRLLLFRFCLTGESQERERILRAFSERYFFCNPTVFRSPDETHALAFAVLLLNTDLHAPNIKKRMKFDDFEKNLHRSGFKYSKPLLKMLYHSIKKRPIEYAVETEVSSRRSSAASTGPSVELYTEDAIVYQSGWLSRKCILEHGGQNTPLGRRSWRAFFATLKGVVLYLHRDQNGFRKNYFLTAQHAVPIFHCFATEAIDYGKKANVFRLQTGTGAEYLFQCRDQSDMISWIRCLNLSAATHSAPCLPAPVGSVPKSAFSGPAGVPLVSTSLSRRYALPRHRTKNATLQQIRCFEDRLTELEKELETYHNHLPQINGSSRLLKLYAENEIYALQEMNRYKSYIQLLNEESGQILDSSSKNGFNNINIAAAPNVHHFRPIMIDPINEESNVAPPVDSDYDDDVTLRNSSAARTDFSSTCRSSYDEAIKSDSDKNMA